MNRQFVAENARARERLRSLVDKITDAELALALNAEGWTVAVALAHVAFWDERRLVLVRKWKKDGVTPSPVDTDVFNDALVPFLSAIPPRKAASMSIRMAEAIDRELEEASPDLIAAMEASGDIHALDRSVHRKMHLDEIEAVIRAKRPTS
ncbi:MAG: maleylpyruvate isomerase N-terminal domain-containing protein [Dehalococcoidia bacterium]|nr:maleylpyruvate isomerase N-terminal domain-containing protein [Dehalococcoidia bacterium]